LDTIISKKLNTLEERIIKAVEAWEKNKKQKENLLRQLEIYKKKLNEEVKKEKEILRKKISLLQKERKEIKQRIKILLQEISPPGSESFQAEDR